MGYDGKSDIATAWNTADSEKMEASTIQTASERTRDEDDDTTIQSLDSALEMPSTPQFGCTIPDLGPAFMAGTPETLSTAHDEASLTLDPTVSERMPLRWEGGFSGPNSYHNRVPSWEGLPHTIQHSLSASEDPYFAPAQGPAPAAAHGAWGHPRGTVVQQQQQQQRVASFRYPPMAPRWQQQQSSQRFKDPQVPFLPGRGESRSYVHHPLAAGPPAPFHPYQMHELAGNGYATPPLPPVATPPRARGPKLPSTTNSPRYSQSPSAQNSSSSAQSPSTGGPRSSSEILKTLLRKKACLYEPDTSRAVTLITWLVGRHLALERGFFSRQQLQAGVHSCVGHKIESGVITRTKVNRCMQIILNSCFHYIIPRPDGTEENGFLFRETFASEVSNDDFLLKRLPAPWNDMVVHRDSVLLASRPDKPTSPDSTPQNSPQLASLNAAEKLSPGGKESLSSNERDEGKRAVLLCFNENVRCAEDVFRCHNEFIHDTAHASNLQLSSLEWRQFFGKEAASTPYLWGNVGIPVTQHEGRDQTDALGVMTSKEAGKFRTSWCAKRYDHKHELCGFAHAQVNGGWLRRDPSLYSYKDAMCPHVSKLTSGKTKTTKILILNECPQGINCAFAHSIEEIAYHPNRYKGRLCQSATKVGGCTFGHICPDFHPLETYKFPKKPDSRSPRHARQSQPGGSTKAPTTAPNGAPILYASPAPLSSFDRQIFTPGLRNLYRRHCSVVRTLMQKGDQPLSYSYFGDDVKTPRGKLDDNAEKAIQGPKRGVGEGK